MHPVWRSCITGFLIRVDVPNHVVGQTVDLVSSSFGHLRETFRLGLVLKGICWKVDACQFVSSGCHFTICRARGSTDLIGAHLLSLQCSRRQYHPILARRPCCPASHPSSPCKCAQYRIACILKLHRQQPEGSGTSKRCDLPSARTTSLSSFAANLRPLADSTHEL